MSGPAAAVTTREGAPIAWQQLGEGPDAILIHGLATNRAFWYGGLAQRLKHALRVTLYDLRGHGYSGRPDSGYTASAQADDLLRLMDALGIGQADLVGHSYGGGIALELAVAHPDRVRTLTLMDSRINAVQPKQWLSDSPHLSDFEQDVAAADGRDWAKDPQIGFTFMEVMARLHLSGYRPQRRDAFTPFSEGRGGQRLARQFVDLIDQTTAMRDFITPCAPAEALAKLRVPLTLMYGEYSRCRPSGEALAKLLPHASYHVLPQGGHFFPVTHAEAVNALVMDVLGCPPASQEAA